MQISIDTQSSLHDTLSASSHRHCRLLGLYLHCLALALDSPIHTHQHLSAMSYHELNCQ